MKKAARDAVCAARAEGLTLTRSYAASGFRGGYRTGPVDAPFRALLTEMPSRFLCMRPQMCSRIAGAVLLSSHCLLSRWMYSLEAQPLDVLYALTDGFVVGFLFLLPFSAVARAATPDQRFSACSAVRMASLTMWLALFTSVVAALQLLEIFTERQLGYGFSIDEANTLIDALQAGRELGTERPSRYRSLCDIHHDGKSCGDVPWALLVHSEDTLG